MKVIASRTFCGCATLYVGVLLTCLINFLLAIFFVAIASSREPLLILGLTIPPLPQVLIASWFLVGIPILFVAGFGAVYRIEGTLRFYANYMVLSWLLGTTVAAWFLMSGSACDQMVDPEVQRMGSAFVCTFADVGILVWTLVLGMCHLYMTWIVWSAAEEIAAEKYPKLMRYTDQHYNIQVPNGPPPGPYPLPCPRAEPEPGYNGPSQAGMPMQMQACMGPNGMMGGGASMGAASNNARSMMEGAPVGSSFVVPRGSVPSHRHSAQMGEPQSFFPSPQSG
jgi:hypothetical protein